MSVRSQNVRDDVSQEVEPPHPPSAHSQQQPILEAALPSKQWIASFIDGQYHLTDPQSFHKLQHLEQEIEK